LDYQTNKPLSCTEVANRYAKKIVVDMVNKNTKSCTQICRLADVENPNYLYGPLFGMKFGSKQVGRFDHPGTQVTLGYSHKAVSYLNPTDAARLYSQAPSDTNSLVLSRGLTNDETSQWPSPPSATNRTSQQVISQVIEPAETGMYCELPVDFDPQDPFGAFIN